MATINALTVELEIARKLFWLLLHDYIFLSSYNEDKKDWDDGAYPAINCNDVFVPGADAQGLHADELDNYIATVKKWPNAGSYAWCVAKRNTKPWRPLIGGAWKIEYDEALKHLTNGTSDGDYTELA